MRVRIPRMEKRAGASRCDVPPRFTRQNVPARFRSGVTVLELMIVIGIIALLSALAVPAMRGFGRANTIASANRQLLDDFALARQRAINERSVVHVLFVPPYSEFPNIKFMGTSQRNLKMLTNIMT